MEATSNAYGLDHQVLALPNYVQVGPTGDGLYIANPDFDLRYDQSFPLAKLVARAPTGTISPQDGMAELGRIRNLDRRFPVWIAVVGYAVESTGLALILQPTPWSLVGAATLGPYAGQWIGNALLGSYASGFGGGLTLILFALAISHRPNTPPTMSLVLPGFWLLAPGSLGFMGVTQLLGTHSTAVFTATLISMMSIAVGVQTGLLLWRAAIQLSDAPNRRAFHD